MGVIEPRVLRGTISGSGDGYGSGSGDGYGSGSGDGSGDGYGSGSGYGYGSGYGSGSGSGYGYGSGYGSGYGYGSGSGDGSGDGYGSGSGDGSGDGYWAAWLDGFRVRAPLARIAFWKSTSDGSPANGGTGTVARVGLVEEMPGPIRDQCGTGQLHATLDPSKWNGDRLWVVALYGEVRVGGDKLWALKREIIEECLWYRGWAP